MRVLVVGAGSIGGYFGGRLLQAARDVTFLVRPGRATALRSTGLVIKSPHGDAAIKDVPTVVSRDLKGAFDLILVSCKAFDLDEAINSFAVAVGNETIVLPMLNGMRHLDVLDQRFGSDRVFGGFCAITTTLNADREIVQSMPIQQLVFGARTPAASERAHAIAALLDTNYFESIRSDDIAQEMWEKWIFIACLSAATCLLRASVGGIVAVPGGKDFLESLAEECVSVASAYDHRPVGFFERAKAQLTLQRSPMTASMFRDMSLGAHTEADHTIGDLVARAEAAGVSVPKLKLAYTALQIYEHQRSG